MDSPKPDNRSSGSSFGGAAGAASMIICMPLTIVSMLIYCHNVLQSKDPDVLPIRFLNLRAFIWYAGWFLFQVVLHMMPLGAVHEGLPIKSGKRLRYRCNALIAFVVTLVILSLAYFGLGYRIHQIFDQVIPLSVAALTYVTGLSIYLYRRSLKKPSDELSEHGSSGDWLIDFFMGRELNPRIGTFDWKFFCELRPGLIGWVVVELGMLAWQYEKTGSISIPLLLIVIYHAWYVSDGLWNEPAVLSTKDIIEEGFGFMLACGDLAYVPFFYSTQTFYIVAARPEISSLMVLFSISMHVIGYWIFRQSNLQKNWFRNNPSDPRLQGFRTIPTLVPGKNLLCGGWWCFVRHPNYLGDLLMTISWTSLCGFGSIIPFVYCVYMFMLLIHREIRDEEVCGLKYGEAWQQYKSRVPWRIFPLLF